MDTSTSSGELESSFESVSSGAEGQTKMTSPHRPSPFTLRSQCASERCPHGTGILFRSRISPSPSKTRVRSRRRRRSDQAKHNVTGDTSHGSSFLELSHGDGYGHLREDEHLNHHHHHLDTHHGHYQHDDGIHNIDHHHVHFHDRQLLVAAPRILPPKELNFQSLDPLLKEQHQQFAEVRLEGSPRESYHSHFSSYEHSRTRADILFEELQKEEEERLNALKEMAKERTRTTKESTTTTRVRRSLKAPSTNGGPQGGMNGGVTSIAESVKNTVIGFLTPTKDTTLPAIVESSESGFEDGNIIGDKRGTSTPADRFVPAREFFAEAHTRDRLSSDYYSGSDTPSRLRESTRRLSIRKPYNSYIAYSSDEEYDEWKQQPKSDYTYSSSLTYRKRVTPDRKIGSPNMSRRTLKGGNIQYVGSSDFSVSELASEGSNSLDLRSRTIPKQMDVYSDTSDGEVEQHFQARSRRSTRSRSIDMPKTNGSLTRTITTMSSVNTITRTLHRGLDTESDVDDGTESTVPLRATPLTARSGTPLGRATTPLAKLNSVSRRSSATLDAGKGYKLGEGTIAEDLEEEEEESARSTVVTWTRKSWETIVRVTTIITASVAMMAASAVTTSSKKDQTDLKEKKSFFSTVKETRTRIVTTVSEKYNATCEQLRKNPILIWIPLLFILLLLALATYWWLLESRGKTAGATDPTENDGPSFFFVFLTLVSDLFSWAYSGISSSLAAAWETTAVTCTWLLSACYGGLVSAWISILGMFTWLGSLGISFASFLLQLLYLVVDYLQYCALGIFSFFTSSSSYIYGLFPFATSNDSTTNKTDMETNSWNVSAWISNLSPIERLSEAYITITEGVQSSGTMLWNGWLWLVLSIGEILSLIAAYAMLLLSSIWSALIYLVTGLWTVLTYLFFGLIGFLTTVASVVSSAASNTSSAIATGTERYVLPFFRSSEKVESKLPIITSPPKIDVVQDIIQQSVNIKGGTVEEIVRQVLDSDELKSLIAAAVAESSKGQLTIDAVSGIAKSVVERELGAFREETSALKTEIQNNAVATSEHQSKIILLREEKAQLIKNLEELGQRLYNVEGKVEVADRRSVEDRQQNEEQIEQLVQQINKLQEDHTNLAADVKSCCDEKKVPAILGEIFGLTANGTADESSEGKTPLSPGDVGAWLRSYFVAKEELESRLNSLMATMQVKTDIDESEKSAAESALTQAAVAQTTQIVMDTVLEKLRVEMNKQHTQFSGEAQQQVSEQVNLQVKAAAGILGQQVLEQVQLQVQKQKQQLSDTLKANVDSAVEDAVSSALPEAVDNAVSRSVDVAVTNAVNTAVPVAVNEAVPQAIDEAVPEVVMEMLPNVVSEQIATAVPEVVASVLPAAVSTAVNETVTSAVSEAMVHVSVNNAGDQASEVNKNTVNDGVAVVGSSATVDISHEGSSSNLFPTGMHLAGGLNESAVIQIVKDALRKYDADKTGMVDHALESAGGNIISTRCTESYQVHQAEVRVLGFPLYRYSTNNPRTVIQPDTMPGQCWAFKGSQGYIVIQLAGPVKPTGFTLEHISKSLSPNGKIDSAPREFEVFGLSSENEEGVFLGKYEYLENGEPLQYFPVKEENEEYFPLIELIIDSNHGSLHYTCLYRFRVHGLRYF